MNHLSKFLRTLFRLYEALLLLALFGFSSAQGASYYVAKTGNDSNPGTLSQPFESFAQGVSALEPGDTLYIRGGIYTEKLDLLKKTGVPGKQITIAAYPGDTVTLQPVGRTYAIVPRQLDYVTFDGLIWDGINMDRSGNGVYGPRIIESKHTTFQNMEFKRIWGMIYISRSTHTIFRNCKIHDFLTETGVPGTRYMGIYAHDGTDLLIEGNDIYNNPGGGMQIQPGPWRNVIIRNNRVHDNLTLSNQPAVGGILVWASLHSGGLITDAQIYNNVVYNNGLGAGRIVGKNYAPGINISNATDGAKVWNNTVYGNSGYGLSVQNSTTTNTVVQNNISFENTDGAVYNGGIGSVIDHNLTTNPRFINMAEFDFRLQSNSPAIDRGVALTEVTMDILNIRRPKGETHDIGAYEGGVSDFSQPRPPKSLVID
ncbi:MAG: right-handed parallel beta-helix repeat-containing protein [Nitrospira sp.]|nr:right-handed parallel beta-helix repeat-containing protein [Nitrospira sp.]